MKNIFISHYNVDEESLDSLKSRLKDIGCNVRNSSVENKDNKNGEKRRYKVTDATIARYLRKCIRWAKTFIVLIGEDTHKRPWVNYEIRTAARMGKPIVGIYKNGCKNNVELPEAYKRYGGSPLGWKSIDKLADIIDGKQNPPENPDSSISQVPIYNIITIKC